MFSLGRKIAKVAAVVSDVFGHFVVGLREIDDAAFSLPTIDEIVYDTVLVAFTNQVIKDNDFLLSIGSSSSGRISSPSASMV